MFIVEFTLVRVSIPFQILEQVFTDLFLDNAESILIIFSHFKVATVMQVVFPPCWFFTRESVDRDRPGTIDVTDSK